MQNMDKRTSLQEHENQQDVSDVDLAITDKLNENNVHGNKAEIRDTIQQVADERKITVNINDNANKSSGSNDILDDAKKNMNDDNELDEETKNDIKKKVKSFAWDTFIFWCIWDFIHIFFISTPEYLLGESFEYLIVIFVIYTLASYVLICHILAPIGTALALAYKKRKNKKQNRTKK